MIMVTLPTYNEAQNIGDLMDDILALRPDLQIVVIDDDSPDGTHNIVRERAAQNSRLHLIHRRGRRGRGSAGIEGFQYAVKSGADLIVEMDADYSHHPRFIPAMIRRAEEGADVVIGSRLVRGGGETGRSFLRTLITHAANFYIRLVLGLSVRDCTSGFRVFRRRALEAISLDTLQSNGPAIVQEVLLRCRRKGFRIVEEPILFEERRAGTSTFNTRIMLAGLWSVLKFRFK
ncbi:MAG TPA: polyprenol monophosphomannose synthase [Candidatus Sumerlaeota bacterium]|nr:polyprenol monophosphomannose synthase [Candidatus Sumerlaeota bacterium]